MRTLESIHRPRGFTLVELLITLVIVGIVLTASAPSIAEFLASSRTVAQTNDLLADLSMARSEAVKLARPVELRANPTWSEGWIVGSDYDDDGMIAGSEVFRSHEGAATNFSIAAVDGDGDAITAIAFNATGSMQSPAGFADFAICRPDADANKSRSVRVSAIGRAEVRRKLATDGASC